MTAAARIVVPSGESILFFSERIRAVMPTLVAVLKIPRKRQRGSMKEADSSTMPSATPKANDTTTPPSPTTVPATE
ncbi:hypothetical protein SDC9_106513 [bioreactor metagenome]|uniref:Uncharacterized protein n=1 Tax=bioreactor metagenome TaxID=1076179 RepID=A0A645B2P6_9ZZZZ